MNTPKESILSIVSESDLSEKQKDMWHGFLENIDEELAGPIAETIQDDRLMLQLLTENLESKMEALSTDNPDAWNDVIQKEKEVLKKMEE